MIVRKEFFIDLRLPYAAVRGEQIEVKAILHNLSPDDITVSVANAERRGSILPHHLTDNQHQGSDTGLCCLIAKVRVDLLAQEDICSSASKQKKYRQEVTIASKSTRAVPYVIIPMKHGEFPIAVEAAVKDSVLNDGVEKMLRVVVRTRLVLFFFKTSFDGSGQCSAVGR